MRGIFFQQPLEFRLEVIGDEWRQGDRAACRLAVINRGSAAQSVQELSLHLACGTLKKVKQKADDAFAIVSSAENSPPAEIEPGGEASVEWSVQLDKNCTITDKQQSLFLICGRGPLEAAAGHLQLNVYPHAHVEAVTSLFETYFSFVLKGQKSKKEWLESKFKPPEGKRFAALDNVLLMSCFEGESLVLKFIFKSKKLSASAAAISVSKVTREHIERLEPDQYILSGGYVDNDALQRVIKSALSKVESTL